MSFRRLLVSARELENAAYPTRTSNILFTFFNS
jgi:hypothetical protein